MALSETDLDLVARAPLFSEIDRSALTGLMEGAFVQTYAETGLLFSEGDRADRFFVILDGRVSLYALMESGDHSIIEVFHPIMTFAEAAMFSSAKFPLNCEVSAGSRLVHVAAAPFLRRLSDTPKLGMLLLSGLAGWQFRLIREIAELKGKSPGQRLASFLVALASSEEGKAQVRLPISKSVLASRIGVTPESLSRALARLKSVGVESRGRDVVITDVEALKCLVRESGD